MTRTKKELVKEASQVNPLALQQEQTAKLMEIAINSDGGVEKLEKIMVLQERMEANYARKAFFDALSHFQSMVPIITKKGLAFFGHINGGGKTEYKFARLEDIADAIKAPLAEVGLSYRFEQVSEQTTSGPFTKVICIVTHCAGHSETSEMSAYPDSSGKKNAIQQLASTVSYLRRYTLTGGLGLTVSDDDHDGQDIENDEQTDSNEHYSEQEFVKAFPAWQKLIESGKHSSGSLLNYLAGKGVHLSEEQKTAVHNINQGHQA